MKSDWDLENAYLGNAKPYLEIKVQKINVSQSLANEDWDIITTSELNRVATYAGKQTSQLANNFLNKVSSIEILVQNNLIIQNQIKESIKLEI